jgi:uncharacterized protein
MAASSVLARIDRAAFAAALGRKLRLRGLPIGVSRLESFSRALSVVKLDRRSELYWSARISLVRRPAEIPVFDQVFAAVFADALFAMDPLASRLGAGAQPAPADGWAAPGAGVSRSREPAEDAGRDLPWMTKPMASIMAPADDDPSDTTGLTLAQPLPSAAEGWSDVPFDQLDPAQLRMLSAWLDSALADWPHRRSRRNRRHPRGRRIDLRTTLARSRATGFEPLRLARSRPVHVRRPLVMLCDVSQSMRPYTQVYVHLMRAAALTVRAEVFAFSTDLTRLTPALGMRSDPTGQLAIERAAERVSGGSPGTRIGYSLQRYLASRHGSAARGAIVIIASDGWDADDPAILKAAMARLNRRARSVIWVNPRAAATGFVPLTGAMATALPYCDQLLPGHTLASLRDVVDAIGQVR